MRAFWKPAIGIDLGSRVIKGVELSKHGGKICLDRYFFHDAAAAEALTPEQLARQLPALISAGNLKNKNACAALSDSDVMIFNLRIPEVPENEIAQVVRNEVERRLTFAVEGAVIDFGRPVPFKGEDGRPGLMVRAYCSKREAVLGRMHALEDAQLYPQAIESELLANLACLDHNRYLSTTGTSEIVIDFGNHHTTLALIYDREPLAIDVVPKGGFALSSALSQQCEMSFEAADELRRRLPWGPQDFERPEHRILYQEYERFADELRQSIDFFHENSLTNPVQKILILGSATPSSDFAQFISSQFGLPCETVDPLRAIEVRPSVGSDPARLAMHAPYLSVAVGLALRSFT